MSTSRQTRRRALVHHLAKSWLQLAACCCAFKAEAVVRSDAAWSEADLVETNFCAAHSTDQEESSSSLGASLLQVAKADAPRGVHDERRLRHKMLPSSDFLAAETTLPVTALAAIDASPANHWAGSPTAVKADHEHRKEMEEINKEFKMVLQNELTALDAIDASPVNHWAGSPTAVKADHEHTKEMEEINEEFKMAMRNEQKHIKTLQDELAREEEKVAQHAPRIKSFAMDEKLSLAEIAKSSLVRVAAQIKGGYDPSLTVEFDHEGTDYSYKLFPESVYTEAAQLYDGHKPIPLEAPKTFRLRDKGRWASLVWHDDGGVQGLLEANGNVMKISPVSMQAPEVAKALLQRYEGSSPPHLVRWVSPPAFYQRSNKSIAFAFQQHDPQLPYNEASHLPDAHGRDPWVGEAEDVDRQSWGGVKWHPGCYRGDDVMHEMLLGFVSDKAARDLFDSTNQLQRTMEAALHEASFVYEMQMNIKLKLDYLKMSKDETEFDACKKAQGQHQDQNYAIALQKLQKIHQLTRDGTVPWHAANHFFTGCADGSSGTAGLAYMGTGCRGFHNVGVTLIAPHHNLQPWDTFAHELGHNFNGSHSFEEGQGITGGIMDYGDGKLDGHYQFNTKYRKTDMCGYINETGPRCKDSSGKSMFQAAPSLTAAALVDSYNFWIAVVAMASILSVCLMCVGTHTRFDAHMFGKSLKKPSNAVDRQQWRVPPKYTSDDLPDTERCRCFPC